MSKELSAFNKKSDTKDKLHPYCKSCCISIVKKWQDTNINKHLSYRKNYYKNNKENVINISKEYYNKNKIIISYKNTIKYQNNKEQIKFKNYKWRTLNPAKMAAYTAKYNATKLQATPKWLTEFHIKQIECIYQLKYTLQKLTNTRYHVDHIIPLQGKTVSGLHVPWNLQILTAKDNIIKSNKIIN